MRRFAPLAFVFVVGLSVGWVASRSPRVGSAAPPEKADTLEVIRHPSPSAPPLAVPGRVLTVTAEGRTEHLSEPDGSERPVWTVRLSRGGAVAEYTAQALVTADH